MNSNFTDTWLNLTKKLQDNAAKLGVAKSSIKRGKIGQRITLQTPCLLTYLDAVSDEAQASKINTKALFVVICVPAAQASDEETKDAAMKLAGRVYTLFQQDRALNSQVTAQSPMSADGAGFEDSNNNIYTHALAIFTTGYNIYEELINESEET